LCKLGHLPGLRDRRPLAISDRSAKCFGRFSTKTEKRIKKERKPVETAAAVEIDKVAFGNSSYGFPQLLEKASAQNAPAFSPFQQARQLL
jgi:hypothetical protein